LKYAQDQGLLSSLTQIAIDGKIVAPHGNDAKYRFESSSEGLQGFAENLGLDRFFLSSKVGISILKSFYLFSHFKKRREQTLLCKGFLDEPSLQVHRVDHHIAHAASIAFPGNPNSKGLVVTLDGIGEGICSRILRFEKGQLVKLDFTPALGSPALMYGYATKILGYRINRHEGKLTGLAAYGDAEKTASIFLNHFRYHRGKFRAYGIGYGVHAITELKRELNDFRPEDIAAGVQYVLEETVTHWIEDVIRKTGESKLFLSGGAFANVKLNQRIAQLPHVNDIIVSPNMGDGGLALGAAVYHHRSKINLDTLYLGSDIKTNSQNSNSAEIVYEGESFHEVIARLLFEEKIVAIARGNMEYGPRALGNRSILYSAKNKEVNKWLNKMLKRTEFMPFAPMCRDVDAKRNFHLEVPMERYKFMTMTCNVTDFCKETAPAVVHVDGTARPQIVFKEDNADIYKILECYSNYVENPVVVNTSFNMHEEPIVRTAEEAFRAFQKSKIDYLLLGNQLLKNK
jgi:carbamoyltransferase